MQSGNWSQPTTNLYVMENTIRHLESVLGFTMPSLDAPVTRRHYTSKTGSWGPRYVQPKIVERVVVKNKKEFSETQEKMLEIVKRSKTALTSLEISKKIKCCQNHASLTMTAYFRKGIVSRKKVNSGRHRWFIYFTSEEQLNAA